MGHSSTTLGSPGTAPGGALPDGFAAVAIDPGPHGPLRLCVLFRAKPDESGGHFVVLRDLPAGRALLGCVADASGSVRDWVELWVQDPPAAGEAAWGGAAPGNAASDRRWAEEFDAAAALEPGLVLHTGWEREHPFPTFIDRSSVAAVHPIDRSSVRPLVLCTDDALLAARGLPPYGASPHRYLCAAGPGQAATFVPVTPDSPRNHATTGLAEVVEDAEDLVPFNPGGGLLQVRRHFPIRLEPYVDALGGAPWDAVAREAAPLSMPAPERAGFLVPGLRGHAARLAEILHLKLRLIADAVASARDLVAQTGRPMFNLSPGSFHVDAGAPGGRLPFHWTARLVLVRPGEALPVAIEGGGVSCYQPAAADQSSIYRAASGQAPVRGQLSLRLRRVEQAPDGRVSAEGTLHAHERLDMAPRERSLIRFRLRTSAAPMALCAELGAADATGAGEFRFRTVPQALDGARLSRMRSIEGVPLEGVPFEMSPLLGSPCDLYSLGVLAVRILFAHPRRALPAALDEVLSLARQVAAEHDAHVPLADRLRSIARADARWLEALGPHHLARSEMTPRDGLAHVPPALWIETLAMIVKMLPGAGPDSTCASLADAPERRPHAVFDGAMDDLEALLARSRTLVVFDAAANREIHAAIERCAGSLVPAEERAA